MPMDDYYTCQKTPDIKLVAMRDWQLTYIWPEGRSSMVVEAICVSHALQKFWEKHTGNFFNTQIISVVLIEKEGEHDSAKVQ